MKILAIVEAFLEFDDKFLMMHRAKEKKISRYLGWSWWEN